MTKKKRINLSDMDLQEVGMAKWLLTEIIKSMKGNGLPPKTEKYIMQVLNDALEEIKTAEKEWAELMLMQLAESAGLQ